MKPNVWISALFVLFTMAVIGVISAKIDGWDTSPVTQYHIQTDEGPERYFKYQTISGQYRKEKRLQDGTVIGSYGWVDADGYLRLNDYIADNEGYRILKTKQMFVGTKTPIAPKYMPVSTATSNEVSSPKIKKSPFYVEDKSKNLIFPSSRPLHLTVFQKRRLTAPAAYYPISTPPSIVQHSSDDTSIAITTAIHYYVPSKTSYPSVAKHVYKPPISPAVVKNAPQYSRNSVNPYFGEKMNVNKKFFDEGANYDGISVTSKNFKYFLPKQYYEEGNVGDERTGSFGYIDPFGIRRIIYFNAAPGTGFVHKKNNRYVGFNATPFDPRP